MGIYLQSESGKVMTFDYNFLPLIKVNGFTVLFLISLYMYGGKRATLDRDFVPPVMVVA